MFERYRRLSHELLKYATRGLLRKDFLPKVAEKIIDFSGADAVELWAKEDPTKHFRCSLTRSTKMPFGFILVPCPLGEETTTTPGGNGELSLEKLCCDVVNGSVDTSLPGITERGSFWVDDASMALRIEQHVPSHFPVRESYLPGHYKSIALIPIRIEHECIGLLQLKSRTKGFFSIHDLTFYEDVSEVLGVALSHQYAQIELRERVKELTCLYGIARVVAQPGSSFDAIIQDIINLLPPAWLYPEITCARIVLDGMSFHTVDFQETPYRQKADIVVNNRKVGFVEVAYLKKKLTMDEGPFLAEERSLIESVAREVAIFYQRTRAEEEKTSLQDQLRHADRLATIGQLAAGVAHELNEPLGNILGFAQLANKAPHLPEQVKKDLKSIESASLHAREIIRKLMTFSRQLPPQKAPVNLNELVEDGLYFFEARCQKAGIELVLDLARDLPDITIDSGQMNQVLVNLLVNAIQAMPKGGKLIVRTRLEGDRFCLNVEDTGEGMGEELKGQIFLPFFTTKDIHEGTGLGLAVVHGIVTSHGGEIQVDTEKGKGAKFQIRLPLESPDTMRQRRE
jgi:signal transduction histidine kinase